MSLMQLFSGSKAKKHAVSPQESIDKLKTTLDMLEKREAYLDQKIQKEVQNAKENARKNKRAAIMSLKRKKAYEAQIQSLSGARLTIETQIMSIESSTSHFAALNAMQEGSRTMRALNQNMDVDAVEDVMDDIREQIEVSNEIGQAIAQPLGMDMDEADLEDELEKLMEEDLNVEFENVQVPKPTPTPTAKPKAAVAEDDDDEWQRLQAEMDAVKRKKKASPSVAVRRHIELPDEDLHKDGDVVTIFWKALFRHKLALKAAQQARRAIHDGTELVPNTKSSDEENKEESIERKTSGRAESRRRKNLNEVINELAHAVPSAKTVLPEFKFTPILEHEKLPRVNQLPGGTAPRRRGRPRKNSEVAESVSEVPSSAVEQSEEHSRTAPDSKEKLERNATEGKGVKRRLERKGKEESESESIENEPLKKRAKKDESPKKLTKKERERIEKDQAKKKTPAKRGRKPKQPVVIESSSESESGSESESESESSELSKSVVLESQEESNSESGSEDDVQSSAESRADSYSFEVLPQKAFHLRRKKRPIKKVLAEAVDTSQPKKKMTMVDLEALKAKWGLGKSASTFATSSSSPVSTLPSPAPSTQSPVPSSPSSSSGLPSSGGPHSSMANQMPHLLSPSPQPIYTPLAPSYAQPPAQPYSVQPHQASPVQYGRPAEQRSYGRPSDNSGRRDGPERPQYGRPYEPRPYQGQHRGEQFSTPDQDSESQREFRNNTLVAAQSPNGPSSGRYQAYSAPAPASVPVPAPQLNFYVPPRNQSPPSSPTPPPYERPSPAQQPFSPQAQQSFYPPSPHIQAQPFIQHNAPTPVQPTFPSPGQQSNYSTFSHEPHSRPEQLPAPYALPSVESAPLRSFPPSGPPRDALAELRNAELRGMDSRPTHPPSPRPLATYSAMEAAYDPLEPTGDSVQRELTSPPRTPLARFSPKRFDRDVPLYQERPFDMSASPAPSFERDRIPSQFNSDRYVPGPPPNFGGPRFPSQGRGAPDFDLRARNDRNERTSPPFRHHGGRSNSPPRFNRRPVIGNDRYQPEISRERDRDEWRTGTADTWRERERERELGPVRIDTMRHGGERRDFTSAFPPFSRPPPFGQPAELQHGDMGPSKPPNASFVSGAVCRYGRSCRRKICNFIHPEGRDIDRRDDRRDRPFENRGWQERDRQ